MPLVLRNLLISTSTEQFNATGFPGVPEPLMSLGTWVTQGLHGRLGNFQAEMYQKELPNFKF